MRIGLLTTGYPRFEGDVAGCFVRSHARALVAQGHEVEVLAPEPHEATPAPAEPGVELRWVPYLRPRALQRTFYGAGVPDNLRRDPLAWLGPLPFSAALLREARARGRRWDALCSHFGLPCALIAGALRDGREHEAVLHSAELHLLSRLPAGRLLAQRIAAGSSNLRFVSGHGHDLFMGLLSRRQRAEAGAKARVEPMPIELPAVPPHPRAALRAELQLTRFTLLFLGRLVPIKGLAETIEALRTRADLELLVAGEGPERERLARLAHGAPLRVRFLGQVAGARKEALLHAADALLLPSRPEPDGRTEGAPLVIREALARGLPVIASRTGGIPELVRDSDAAWLFEPGSPTSLLRAIARAQLTAPFPGPSRAPSRAPDPHPATPGY